MPTPDPAILKSHTTDLWGENPGSSAAFPPPVIPPGVVPPNPAAGIKQSARTVAMIVAEADPTKSKFARLASVQARVFDMHEPSDAKAFCDLQADLLRRADKREVEIIQSQFAPLPCSNGAVHWHRYVEWVEWRLETSAEKKED